MLGNYLICFTYFILYYQLIVLIWLGGLLMEISGLLVFIHELIEEGTVSRADGQVLELTLVIFDGAELVIHLVLDQDFTDGSLILRRSQID